MSTLYIVATPIGNLEDIPKRAFRILSEVDLILCEDTRVTQRLLDRYEIKTKTLSYHQHSEIKKLDYIISLLKEGKSLALVSDAGTPGISDPGNKLINLAIQQCDNLTIIPIPGPSALTAAASISGLSMDRFLFLGFPPIKKKRKKFFEEIINSKYPVVLYESPYRIKKTLEQINETIKQYNNIKTLRYRSGTLFPSEITIQVVVCRELTKKFETIYRGTIEEILLQLSKEEIKGEFVIVLERK
ncbi:MAG: 16S rRNA (cytidine(1402)-2'-O)-methyltransferase [Candidatus Nealsonbacteria bacterium CG_4_10_14_0_2_um_filter_38_17]|uniref:Ribosomal RNA small subunit methyltransferase I n=2 Tax=Candidatus Nealsoniibacteriota TaxID=1817911 RepID=A0A2M7UXH7_9BACT|nr:MAG: 16S rRNA (cytidine(1402)-2'-O)-methyltransferase [Candidatus Nealsonbacteria bacterium CG23_combo_of_CG06-09_8_20_14_all_38_19]PIZ88691.1 MAG: 16S rRNA (cytidine(1402)-2'-O)-methyltransferase [Candidatus Nealsonbacteria bacterium CG_4_10_14_0_2_um_filter_38_17]